MKMEAQIRMINVDDIIPNRFQPRLQFDQDALNELAASIRIHGIVQPLVVRRAQNKFEIIAGERRYKAAQLVGLLQVPCIICELDDNESAEVAVIENLHRKNLSPIEEAKSYKKILDKKYITQEQLAQRLGLSQSNIANKIRLLNLDETVQQALMKGEITERHARSLLKLTDKFKQVELLNKIINEGLTVRQTDDEIAKILGTYKNNQVLTGNINTNDKIDINVDNLINNTQDIGNNDIKISNYEYHSKIKEDPNKKKSLFFNNLENAPVTMEDPTLDFGFNPFETQGVGDDNGIVDLEDIDDIDEEVGNATDDTGEKKLVEKVYEERVYETYNDVAEGIKDVIKNAKKQGLDILSEEFDFLDIYQFVIRIDKSGDGIRVEGETNKPVTENNIDVNEENKQ